MVLAAAQLLGSVVERSILAMHHELGSPMSCWLIASLAGKRKS